RGRFDSIDTIRKTYVHGNIPLMGLKNKKHTILSQKLSNLRMWVFLDVKKFNLETFLLRFYSIEAFFERN
ncbi:hypothetical protein ABTM53_10935, partial [Acinetobacter baumannii]